MLTKQATRSALDLEVAASSVPARFHPLGRSRFRQGLLSSRTAVLCKSRVELNPGPSKWWTCDVQ